MNKYRLNPANALNRYAVAVVAGLRSSQALNLSEAAIGLILVMLIGNGECAYAEAQQVTNMPTCRGSLDELTRKELVGRDGDRLRLADHPIMRAVFEKAAQIAKGGPYAPRS